MDWMREGERKDPRWSDARPASDRPRKLDEDRDAARRAMLRRRAFKVLLCGVFVAGTVAALLGQGGYGDLLRLQRETALLRAAVAAQQATVARLEREVTGLERDPLALERLAREQLGLSRPGEIDFLLPREGNEEAGTETPPELLGP